MAKRSHVRNKGPLVPVLRCDQDFPVTAVTIERREDSGVSKRIEATIHPRKWGRIGDRLCVKTSIIDTEPQRTILKMTWCSYPRKFLGHEHHGACQFAGCRFDHSSLEHLRDLFGLHVSAAMDFSIRCLADWFRTRCQFDSILRGSDFSQVARTPHVFVLREHRQYLIE